MQMTSTRGELAKALAKAQSQIKHALLDSTNPHFKSKYASLASFIDAIREPLSSNGIAFTQLFRTNEKGEVNLVTILMHESGEYIYSEYPIVPTRNDPQGYGSAITYARRYSLAAIVGIAADEDDDGNKASEKTENPKEQFYKKATYYTKSTDADALQKKIDEDAEKKNEKAPITTVIMLEESFKNLGISLPELEKFCGMKKEFWDTKAIDKLRLLFLEKNPKKEKIK